MASTNNNIYCMVTRGSKSTCGICGKKFYATKDWVYKQYADSGRRFCSYSCMRKYQATRQKGDKEPLTLKEWNDFLEAVGDYTMRQISEYSGYPMAILTNWLNGNVKPARSTANKILDAVKMI